MLIIFYTFFIRTLSLYMFQHVSMNNEYYYIYILFLCIHDAFFWFICYNRITFLMIEETLIYIISIYLLTMNLPFSRAKNFESPIFTHWEFNPHFHTSRVQSPIFTRRKFNPPYSRAKSSIPHFHAPRIMNFKKKNILIKKFENNYNNFYSSLPYLKW